jgi:hypothetical protein
MIDEFDKERIRGYTKKWHCPPASVEALLKAIQDYYEKKKDKKMVKKIVAVLSPINNYYKIGIEKQL